jgi:hypothetical protein
MPSVFQPCGNVVARIEYQCEGSGDQPAKLLTISGGCGSSFSLPMTAFKLEQQCNYQFLHTVNDFIYLYVFGDRVGELQVSGMAFLGGTCGQSSVSTPADQCAAYTFYNTNKVSNCTTPLTISIEGCDNSTFFAFLTGMALEVPRPDLPIVQWGLRFNIVQKKS